MQKKTSVKDSFVHPVHFDGLTYNFRDKEFPSAFEYLWREINGSKPSRESGCEKQHHSFLPLSLVNSGCAGLAPSTTLVYKQMENTGYKEWH